MIRFNRLKDGKKHAVTLSYDDGDKADYRLVEIMNKYGIRGTFHLNSGFLSGGNKVSLDELNDLYKIMKFPVMELHTVPLIHYRKQTLYRKF